jgi:hypothetical protein
MNTTGLIREWTMSGARRDPNGRFRSPDEVRDLLAPGGRRPGSRLDPLLVKGQDEEEWRPLLLAVHEGGGPAG